MSSHPAHGNDVKMTFMTSVCCITRYMLLIVSLLNLFHIVFCTSVLSCMCTQDLQLSEYCKKYSCALNNYCAKALIVRYQSFKIYTETTSTTSQRICGDARFFYCLGQHILPRQPFCVSYKHNAWHRELSLLSSFIFLRYP